MFQSEESPEELPEECGVGSPNSAAFSADSRVSGLPRVAAICLARRNGSDRNAVSTSIECSCGAMVSTSELIIVRENTVASAVTYA